ncbi:hypothetical protein [Pseudomonas syringae]|uniref:hypothetical protein n=1 Tax=Pseudomonas syringae TaxID=317 RepID=UPI001F191C8A|nr:hypothetical protein [Pseudomonas syringae]
MTTYIGWETAVSLLLAYETLALNHRKNVFKTFEALLGLLAKEGVVELAVVLDKAKVIPEGPPIPWGGRAPQEEMSRASWRHDFDIPF